MVIWVGGMFFAYVVFLTKFHEAAWDALLAFAVLLGMSTIGLAKRPGAVGRARPGRARTLGGRRGL